MESPHRIYDVRKKGLLSVFLLSKNGMFNRVQVLRGASQRWFSSHRERLLIKLHARGIIDQKLDLLKVLNQSEYVRVDENFFNASVASHLRHSLDHFSYALSVQMDCESNQKLTYDIRKRGGVVEIDLEAAVQSVLDMRCVIDSLDVNNTALWSKPVQAVFIADPKTQQTYAATSTFERELSFVAHHSTHHLAMIRVMLNAQGIQLNSTSIGMANSTQIHNAAEEHGKTN